MAPLRLPQVAVDPPVAQANVGVEALAEAAAAVGAALSEAGVLPGVDPGGARQEAVGADSVVPRLRRPTTRRRSRRLVHEEDGKGR